MKYDQHGDKEMYEEVYETVCDVVCVKRRTIRINGEDSDIVYCVYDICPVFIIKPPVFHGQRHPVKHQPIQELGIAKLTSRGRENQLQEVGESDPNYTDYNQTEKNYTDMSYPNPINQSVGKADV